MITFVCPFCDWFELDRLYTATCKLENYLGAANYECAVVHEPGPRFCKYHTCCLSHSLTSAVEITDSAVIVCIYMYAYVHSDIQHSHIHLHGVVYVHSNNIERHVCT